MTSHLAASTSRLRTRSHCTFTLGYTTRHCLLVPCPRLHPPAICRDHQATLVNTDWAAKHDRRNNPLISFPHNSLNGAVRFGAVEVCLSHSILARHDTSPDLSEVIPKSILSPTQLRLVTVCCACQPLRPWKDRFPCFRVNVDEELEALEYSTEHLDSCAQDTRCHSCAGRPLWASGEQLSDVSQPYGRQRRL